MYNRRTIRISSHNFREGGLTSQPPPPGYANDVISHALFTQVCGIPRSRPLQSTRLVHFSPSHYPYITRVTPHTLDLRTLAPRTCPHVPRAPTITALIMTTTP